LGLSFFESAANFVIGLVGCGVLCLPYNAVSVGGVGALLLLALCNVSITECGLRVNESITCAELLSGGKARIGSLEDLAGEAFGIRGQAILAVLKNTYWLGVLVVFTSIVTEGFVGLLPSWLPLGTGAVRWFVVYPIFLAGSMLKDLQAVAPLQPLVIGAAFLFCGCIVVGSFCEVLWPAALPRPATLMLAGGPSDVGVVMSTSFFAGGGVESMVPAVRSQMAEPERFASALRLGMAVVLGVQGTVLCSGYLAYGAGTAEIVTDSLTSAFATVCAVAVNFKLCLTVPTFLYMITSVFEALGDLPVCVPLSIPNVAFRVALMTAVFWVGMVLPYVREVIGLFSASIGITMTLFLPLLTYYTMKRRLASSQAAEHMSRGSDVRDYAVHSVLLVIGVCVAYYGITGAWATLTAKMQEETAVAAA